MKKYIILFLVMQDVNAIDTRNFEIRVSRSESPDRVLTPRTELRIMKEENKRLREECQKEKDENKLLKKENLNLSIFSERQTKCSVEKSKVDSVLNVLQEIRNKTENIMRNNEDLAEKNTDYTLLGLSKTTKYVGITLVIIGVIGGLSLTVSATGIFGFLISIAKTFKLVSAWPSFATVVAGILGFFVGKHYDDKFSCYLNIIKRDKAKLHILSRDFDSATSQLLKIRDDMKNLMKMNMTQI